MELLGGVPFVLTNVPQSLLSYSCLNPIYGTTINAYKCDRTAGGSSGGEGSLIACGGSIIGIGGDVGGSLRFPAHFNGITSLKRSGTSVMGRSLVDASLGPMTRTVRDAVTFLKIFWSERWFFRGDPYLPAIYWDDHQYLNKQPLRIGYYYQDGWFEPTPALKRAVQETHSRLEKLGHVLVEFEPPDMADAFKLFLGAILVDDGKYILDKFDKVLQEIFIFLVIITRIIFETRIFGKIVKPFWPRLSKVCEAFALNTSEMRQMFEDIAKYRHRFVREMKALRLDAIICPIQVVPAIEHFYPMKLISTVSYCGLFNLLDFPAGTVKVTEVSEIDELCLKDYPENDLWEKLVKKATKDSVGLPVGVQVASFPFHEETVLRLLAEIEKSVELEKII
ncbi:unnamed protein product [Dracunculus medinensis]|uniref:Amidase domain-containing protein n=1 Tax=Dracunculus medinensis TaxID=318479 RepID=A0A3P7TBZ0_DRAME|nr:unnamed protein product [Dracunculus medinensis]